MKKKAPSTLDLLLESKQSCSKRTRTRIQKLYKGREIRQSCH